MVLFKRKESAKGTEAGTGNVVGFTKPKKIGFFKVRAKPIFGSKQAGAPMAATPPKPAPIWKAPAPASPPKKFTLFKPKEPKPPAAKPIPVARPAVPPSPSKPFSLFGPKKTRLPEMKPLPEAKPAAAPPPKKPLSLFGPKKTTLPEMKPVFSARPEPAPVRKFEPFGPARKPAAQAATAQARPAAPGAQGPAAKPGYKRPGSIQIYFASVAAKHKDLEAALRAQGIKESPYAFVKKMFINTMIIVAVITVAVAMLLLQFFPFEPAVPILLAVLLGGASYPALFNKFIRYPIDRSTIIGNEIERDILFAARDMVISMRSGMPLFNAMAAVSTGYGAASKEFAKVVELVQVGSPIEQAIDDVSSKSKSKTFKRVMLQASVSLKAGADVVDALQGVVEEASQERVIDMRRYGQRLNALAMFYMLFGVIFPSMGIAIAAILTTFVNLFTINVSTLLMVLVGITFLQIIFLNIVRSSRPTFAM